MVHLAAERGGVNEFLRVDAGGRRAGDVADVVGAGAASDDAQLFERRDDSQGVFRRYLADLDIGAGGDIGVSRGQSLGNAGDAPQLMGVASGRRENANGT